MLKRSLIMALALVLALGIMGCQTQPETSPETTLTVPTETTVPPPDAEQIYNDAAALLEGSDAVTLDITKTMTTQVGGYSYVDEDQLTLSYAALDTEEPLVRLEQTVEYAGSEDEDEDPEELVYSEIYADGTVYTELEDVAGFSTALTAQELESRYIPVILLDASIYEALSLEEGDNGQTTVHFAQPLSAESWAIPAEAELLDATGSAVIGADGTVQQMQYSVSYTYGSSQVTLEVTSVPSAETQEVTAPQKPDDYAPISCADALDTILHIQKMTDQIGAASVRVSNMIGSQAGGIMQYANTQMDIYSDEDGLMMKKESDVQLMTSEGTDTYSTEESYRDGKLVEIVNDGLPTTHSGVKDDMVWEVCRELLLDSMVEPVYWNEVTVEDLGGIYYYTFTLSEDYGNNMQNGVCALFYDDPSLLNQYATAYVNKEMTGYLCVDKYTGLMTAYGEMFEGAHTIDGEEYTLTWQNDLAVTAPALDAYVDITDEMPQEQAPETPATPLFYHVTGEDGQEMWLLGTIHIGDERTGFLPQAIYDAFEASDALAMETDSEGFEKQLEEDEKLQQRMSDAYYYFDGTTTADHLDEELYNKALKYLKAAGGYNPNSLHMKPAVWENIISNFYMDLGHQLSSGRGVEERLTRLAKEQEKPIREVESSIFQLELLFGWSEELQKLMLDSLMDGSAQEYWQSSMELYELWCQGDEAALREEINEQVDTSEMTPEEQEQYEQEKALYEEYHKAMNDDRNEGMLKVAIEYLESDEVVFYAVGLAHLLDGDTGLVDALREAGYTVELVAYE